MKKKVVTAFSLVLLSSISIAQAQVQKKKKDSLETKEIKEVVMVAFAKQKKEAIVGSVTSVDAKTLKTQQAPSVLSSLQGSTSGVNVISNGGQPGSNPSIYIRGIGSISADTSPLIILDGVPFDGNINSIPQEQVESISVLKDAASTSLYGSRAANGVIIITSKSGRYNSKTAVNITSLIGISAPVVNFYPMLNAEDFMKYSWQAIKNRNIFIGKQSATEAANNASKDLIKTLGYNPYNVDMPVDANGNIVPGAKLLWDTDWEKYLINKTALKQEHRFSISGGGKSNKFFIGADYLKMDGTVKTSEFERTGVRINVDTKANDWLTAGLRTAYSASQQTAPPQEGRGYTNSIGWIFSVPNIYPLYEHDDKGNLIYDDEGKPIYDYGNGEVGSINRNRPVRSPENAVGVLKYNKTRTRRYDLLTNGYAEATLSKDLKLKSQLGYEQYILDDYQYSDVSRGDASSVKGRVYGLKSIGKTINFTNSLNYHKELGNHSIDAQSIFEVYQYYYDVLSAQGTGFLPHVYTIGSALNKESLSGYDVMTRLVSYLGRLSYNYKDKYFVESSIRTDGSSKFSPDNRWGTFYSAGGSWIITKENFLKDNNTINLLKLRASYGELGNNSGIGYFPYITAFDTGFNQLDQIGIYPSSLTDYNLKWEKTASSNFGLDFALFNRRIKGSIEYFEKKSIDLIYDKPLPISTGNSGFKTNIGSLKNYGWEVNLNSDNFRANSFEWKTNLNLSFIKNKITKLTQKSVPNGTKRWEEGRSMYDFYLAQWAGVDPKDGMGMWYTNELDDHGNKKITKDYNIANKVENKAYVGSSLPKFTGGMTNYFRYGNLDLNILINFSYGGYLYDGDYANLMTGFSNINQQSVDVKRAWQKEGDITDVPINLYYKNNNSSTSTRFLFKNNYVRVKAITLGYNIPREKLQNIGISELRVFLQGDNLFTLQSHKNVDPEQGLSGVTSTRSYNVKTISLGFNVNF